MSADKKDAGTQLFDRVVIETGGLADPAPVAQTFCVDEGVVQRYQLDATVTLVDAKHAPGLLSVLKKRTSSPK